MKTGYDSFFKQAQKARQAASPPEVSADLFSIEESLKKKIPIKKRKKKVDIPWNMASFSFFGFIVALVGIYKFDEIESVLSKLEVTFMSPALAANPSANSDVTASQAQGTEAASEKPSPAPELPAKVSEYSQADLDHFAKLRERKMELDRREEELNQIEAELAVQKQELEKKLAEIERARRDISSVLEERVQVDEQKVETLVQLYSNMKPQQAAKVIETIDEDLAVEVLGRMKKKSAADIMNLLKPEKAQAISEKYTGYRTK